MASSPPAETFAVISSSGGAEAFGLDAVRRVSRIDHQLGLRLHAPRVPAGSRIPAIHARARAPPATNSPGAVSVGCQVKYPPPGPRTSKLSPISAAPTR